jgi:hypothetical protein
VLKLLMTRLRLRFWGTVAVLVGLLAVGIQPITPGKPPTLYRLGQDHPAMAVPAAARRGALSILHGVEPLHEVEDNLPSGSGYDWPAYMVPSEVREQLGKIGHVHFVNAEPAGGRIGHADFRDKPAVLSNVGLTLQTGVAPGYPDRPLKSTSGTVLKLHSDYPGCRVTCFHVSNDDR